MPPLSKRGELLEAAHLFRAACTACGAVSLCVWCAPLAAGGACPRCPPPAEEAEGCVVCMEAPATHAYAACGHRCVCAASGMAKKKPAL